MSLNEDDLEAEGDGDGDGEGNVGDGDDDDVVGADSGSGFGAGEGGGEEGCFSFSCLKNDMNFSRTEGYLSELFLEDMGTPKP